jgi:hypothetical protein
VGTLALILIPAAIFVAVVAGVVAFRNRGIRDPQQPWWGSPVVWVAGSLAFVLLGVFVFPRLFGFTILFLPFLLARSFGRRRPGDHERREPPADY